MSSKLTALTDLPVPVGADLAYIVDDAAGTPTEKKATLTNFTKGLAVATLTASGIIEIATPTEVNTGTDDTRAVSPVGLTAWTGDTALVTVGALDAGSITSGFGSIDIGASALSTTGTITGPSGTWDVSGMNIATGDSYAINATDVLTATVLGTGVLTSSLTTVGALNSGSITSGFGNIDIGTSTLSATGTMTGPSGTWDAGGMDIATGDSYAINATDVLTATVLGSGVLASSLTSVGTLAGLIATGNIDFSGASEMKVPVSATPTVNADGELALDTTVTDFSLSVMKFFGGEEQGLVSMPIAEFTTPTDTHVVAYNATNDEFELVAPSGGLVNISDDGATGVDIGIDSATTAAVITNLTILGTSSGTPANGIGVGADFVVETAAGNNEIGGQIEVVATDVTATSEDFEMVFNLMKAGAAATEMMTLTHAAFTGGTIGVEFGGTADALSISTNNIGFIVGTAAIAVVSRFGGMDVDFLALGRNIFGTITTAGVTQIHEDDAGAHNIALRNADNAYTLNIYGDYASATDFQRNSKTSVESAETLTSGATVTATNLIPANAFVTGITTRVDTAIGTGNGTTGYTVGTSGDADLWGSVSATAVGTSTDNNDITSVTGALGHIAITAQDVVLTALTGNFDGTGVIKIIVHFEKGEAD